MDLPRCGEVAQIDDSDLWNRDAIRVFLSHSALHKGFAAEVSGALELHGLHGFVAHDAIEVSRVWQDEIERALRTAQVFVGLVHPEFIESVWANQEVGWAYGRGLPLYMVRLGADPQGFPGKRQWPSMSSATAEAVAGKIAGWVNSLEEFGETIGGRLIAALRAARTYQDAGQAARALNEFDALTPLQWTDLDEVYLENDQVHGSVLADRGLAPLYARHGRKYPKRPSRSDPGTP